MKIYSPWSKTEINTLKENFNKLSNKEISQILKRTTGAIARKKCSLKLIKSTKWSKQNIIKELKILSDKLKYSPTARDISPRLYQACLRYFDSFNKAKQAAELTIIQPKYFKLEDSAKILSPNLAYILGVCLGDAYVCIQPGRKNVKLCVRDKDFALKFKIYLESWSGRSPSFYIDNRSFYVVNLYSKDVAEFVKRFNIRNILVASRKIKCYFLRGLFDSEGSVGISNLDEPRKASRHIGFYNANKYLIYIVSKILKQINIEHSINTRIHSGFKSKKLQYEIIITGFENILRFKKYIDFSIERKRNKLNILLKSYKGGKINESTHFYY